MADIFDEVSEDLRQDQILHIWKKYSKFIVGFITLIIISIFSYQAYNSWYEDKLNIKSEHFFNALEKLEEKKNIESIDLFSKNLTSDDDGYLMLSNFGLAELNFKNNEIEKMIYNYESIYNNKNIDDHYQYLARFLSVIKDNKSSYQSLHDRLMPVLSSPNKLQTLAAELEISILINFDKINKAQEALKALLDRKDISFEQKNRLILINKIYQSNE